MWIRRLMATAAGGLAIATGAGQMNSLQAQNAAADFRADAAFVNQVAAGNLLEVRLGQLASNRAQTQAVKDFATRMVNDHTTMQQQWMDAARKNNASFNADWSPAQKQEVARLNGLSGTQFEQGYMDLMVQNHQNNLNVFQTQGRAARSAEVRDLVDRSIPALQEHYNLAIQVRNQVNAGASVAANTNAPAQQPTAPGQQSPWENVKRDGGTVPTQQPNQPGQQTTQPAQQPTPTQPAPQPTVQTYPDNTPVTARARADFKADARFFHNAVTGNVMQQRLAELAEKKAENPAVKRYAQMMAKDHAALQQHWIAAASRNGMPVTPSLGPKHADKLEKLEKRSGRRFDREYMSLMVKEHQEYLDYFQREGRAAHSDDVRAVVNREIPVLWDHFNLAKRVGAQVGADTDPQPRATSSR